MSTFQFVLFICEIVLVTGEYIPTWDSLDSRPLPSWYDEAKVGIFIHWGVYSVPSYGSVWFWADLKGGNKKFIDFMSNNYPPGFTYQDFARDFTAEFFDPVAWAELFEAAGAQYVILTSKHHDGFALWPSKYSFSWNSMDVGPNRDLVGELAQAIRNQTKMRFGLYHSLFEWYHPLWKLDSDNKFSTNYFVHGKILPEMKELVEQYQPEVLWSDGDWDAPDWYWNSTAFLSWLYNSSPVKDTVVSNDRWGSGILCKHGDFYTCSDRYNPGILQKHKWENAMTIDRKCWGYRREAVLADFLTFEELIKELMSTISCGGNILIDVGPTKEGTIPIIFEERLRQLGAWLQINGEAVYKSRPWTYQNETVQTGIWYTKRNSFVYAAVLDWPKNNLLVLNQPKTGNNNVVSILGYAGEIKSHSSGTGITIALPDMSRVKVSFPWVLKFTNITN